jgi:hypothetical protein
MLIKTVQEFPQEMLENPRIVKVVPIKEPALQGN